jgi:hypothetical protein
MADETTIEVVLSSESTVGNPIIETVTVVGTVPIGPRGPAGADSTVPGPEGPQGDPGQGVPVGGTEGQVLAKNSATNYDTEWVDQTGGGGGAPTDATYLTATAHGDLSAEVVVGATPGGELGGTWASPTVDATHSGSSHAGVQAAAEATAAAALASHEADTTSIHGIANTANLETTAGAQAKADAKVTQTITNGVTTTAPSEDAVFDALALKQPLDADLTALAAAGNSAVLAATTASFLTADETKLDGIEAGAQVNPSTEAIQDIVGGMVSGGTETGIAVSYDDTNARLDFVAEVTQAELDLKANDADVVHDTGAETIAGVKTFSSDPIIPDEAYDATAWNGVLEPPTKNAVRDEIESLAGELATSIADGDASTLTSANAHSDALVSDTAYDATSWNGVTGIAASKNAVRDKIEDILDGVTFTGDVVVPDEAYDATAWNGSLEVPTKNAVRDKIETISGGGTFVRRVRQTLTDKTSFSGTGAEQVGTEEAVLDDAVLPSTTGVTAYASCSFTVFNTTTAGFLNVYLEISLDGGSTWTAGTTQFIREAASGNANTGIPMTVDGQVTGTVTGDIQARVMAACSVGASTNYDILGAAIHMEVLV